MTAVRSLDGEMVQELANKSSAGMVCWNGVHVLVDLQRMGSLLTGHVYLESHIFGVTDLSPLLKMSFNRLTDKTMILTTSPERTKQ